MIPACGADAEGACNDYVAAWQACLDEAYATNTTAAAAFQSALDSACDSYSGLKGSEAKSAADLLNCYADTISAGDCSTDTAYADTIASITTSCTAE